MKLLKKDPDAVLDYGFDWTRWLASGETITTSTWSLPAGVTAGNGSNGAPAPSTSDGITKLWLLGGTARDIYEITNEITTSAGRTDDRTFRLQIVER